MNQYVSINVGLTCRHVYFLVYTQRCFKVIYSEVLYSEALPAQSRSSSTVLRPENNMVGVVI